MKKRILLILGLIACMLFAFGGCGEKETPPPDDNPPSGTVIALNKTELTVFVGSEEQLLLENASGKTAVWESSDKTVATVDAEGTGAFVKGIKAGTATITVTVEEQKLTCTVTVRESPLSVFLPDAPTGSLRNGRLVLIKNGVATVRAMSEIELSGTPKWTSSDESVGTVEYQGLIARVKAVARGECTITVECDGYKASFTLLVGKVAS